MKYGVKLVLCTKYTIYLLEILKFMWVNAIDYKARSEYFRGCCRYIMSRSSSHRNIVLKIGYGFEQCTFIAWRNWTVIRHLRNY